MNLPQNLFDGNAKVQFILCQADKTRIGEILPSDKHGNFKFNSYSEISFTIDRYYNDFITGEIKINPYYDLIESPRIIELRGVGHFVIQDGDESIEETDTKTITAFSLEYSTGQKYLENFYVNTGEEGSVETIYHAQTHGAEYAIDVYYKKATTWDKFERYYKREYTSTNAYNYVEVQVLDENDFGKYAGTNSEDTLYVKAYPNVRFYWPSKPELSLLHLVFAHIPEWKIGHVDRELWYEERTFQEDRTGVYDFLYNIAAPTVKFVMVWDTVSNNRQNTVDFYKTEEDGITTELISASTYIEDIVYFNKDGSMPQEQPKNNDDIIKGDYYIKYDAIETQWNTDVFISKDNLASQIDISYSADDIKTKLKITGADTLDVRDVNLGQNYILNLSYYNTDLWMGKDLHMKYDQYTKYLAEKTDEYSALVSKWAAAYNEYSDLMNYIPIDPSVLLIGDEFDVLPCTYGLTKATKYVENGVYYDINGDKKVAVWDEDKNLQGVYYINTVKTQRPILKKKLGLYRVGVDEKGTISSIDKTDDVLLTLENDAGDSATIRVKCEETASKYEEYQYLIYRTLTTASSGLSETEKRPLDDWIKGVLTAENLKLSGFKVKSIGTLGSYLCLARDETKKENVEDYGIKLLEEKQDVYTTIFITQTEGYMSKEGARCVAADADENGDGPKGATVGDKWLDTSSNNAEVKEWNGSEWVKYSVNTVDSQNSAEFENYTRFLDNYEKLQVVQETLKEKQRIADYLQNGIAVNKLYLKNVNQNDDNLNLVSLLRAAIMHHMTLDKVYVISISEPTSDQYKVEGALWVQYSDYHSNVSIYKYTSGEWIALSPDETNFGFDSILTDYFVDKEKQYGYLTYIFNPEYVEATEYTENDTYFVKIDEKYKKFYVQPNNSSDVNNMYEGKITNTIEKDTVCYFSIGDKQYTFKAPQNLDENSILVCNPDAMMITAGITTLELTEYSDEEVIADTTGLSFEKITYYIAKGLEYAVYTTNGTPYVSYAHSQGMCLIQMNYIKELTDMNNYFSDAERMRLSPFIREDEYSDSNFLLTGYESEEEQIHIKQELLKTGTEELNQICQPKFSFNATMANLLSMPEFEPLRWQFKLGNFIRVGIRKGYEKRARLLEVRVSFDDESDFSCTFGDLISTKSQIDKHADLLKQSVTVAKQVATHSANWQKGANVATELDKAIAGGLQDATLEVGKANNQNIQIGPNGIWGRKLKEGSTDEWEDEQFRLINNKLVFSSDGFKTSKAVFGKYTVNGETRWGPLAEYITADTIEGKFISGGSLMIGTKESGTYFHVDEDGSVTIKTGSKDAFTTADDLNSALQTIEDAYRYTVRLTYTGSTILDGTETTATVITAKVYDKGTEINVDASKFNWKRNSGEGADADNKWNQEHKGITQIEVDHEDVINNTHFWCEVDDF